MNVDDFGRSAAASGQQPPDIDLLADFHAGVLDDKTSAEVAAYVQGSPDAQAVLRALDATVSDLASLPPVVVPEFVVRRIDAALANESGRTLRAAPPISNFTPMSAPVPASQQTSGQAPPSHGANVVTMDELREKRSRRTRFLTAVAAGIVILGGGVYGVSQIGGSDSADSSKNVAGASYDSSEIDSAATNVQAFGGIQNDKVSKDVAGKMAELSARRQCLSAIPERPINSAPTAVQQISYEGKDAFAFVFPVTDSKDLRIIVVSTSDCSQVYQDKTVTK